MVDVRQLLDPRHTGSTYFLNGLSGSGGSSWCSGSGRHGNFLDIKPGLTATLCSASPRTQYKKYILTFSNETKSAACSNVSPEMSSTILFSFGSAEVVGGGGVCEVEGVAASVANHRELPDRSTELCDRKKCRRKEREVEQFPFIPIHTGLLAHREKFTREAERTTEERRL